MFVFRTYGEGFPFFILKKFILWVIIDSAYL